MPPLRSVVGLLAILALFVWPGGAAGAGEESDPERDFQPPAGLAPGWYASLETSMGDILARLLPEQAPQSVAHFAGLAQGTLPWYDVVTGETVTTPYYDGLLVHTVMAGRLFETGDAGSVGRGLPMLFVPETEGAGPVGFNSSYVLGMTRLGGARVSAAKFFVTVAAQPWLNGESPCFGVVIEGQETVFNISQVKAYSNRRPLEDVVLERVRVFAVGDPAPLPAPQPYEPRRKEVEAQTDRPPPPPPR